jgi:predicted nuclease of predicted toxin-antitoxin system
VLDLDLGDATDAEIWDYATNYGCVVISWAIAAQQRF